MTKEALRKSYRNALDGLTYDNASPSEVRAAIEQKVGIPDSPAAWVEAIESVKMPCKRCASTGRFITRVENGVPTGPGGVCYRCDGKGYQTHKDGHRNHTHDRHYDPILT